MKKYLSLLLASAIAAFAQPTTPLANVRISGTNNVVIDAASLKFGTTTPGFISGAAGALTLTGAGTNQPFTLSPSGTGALISTATLSAFNVASGITPAAEFEVDSTLTTSPRGIMSAQFNTGTDGARFHGRKARGTRAVPLTVAAADNLTRWVGSGYDGSNYLEMASIIFGVPSGATVAATRVPTEITLQVGTNATPSVLTNTAVFSSTTGIALTALGTNQSITLTPSGTGLTKFANVSSTSFIGSTATSPTYAGLWLGQATPSDTNETIVSNGGNTQFNAPSGSAVVITTNGGVLGLTVDAAQNTQAVGTINHGGNTTVATQYNATTTTLATVTGLSVTVVSGKTYNFRAVLHVTADAVGGLKYTVAGTGSTSATSVIWQQVAINAATGAVISSSRTAALGTTSNFITTTSDMITIEGSIVVNVGGPLVISAAQQAANGTSSVLVGSSFIVWGG